MKDIKLLRLQIRNFKGIRELDIALDGKDVTISGENGTGKTSIIDSFTWLLFGKDSIGKSDFGIKPIDENGEVIHQLETSVEAVFKIASEEKAFKKTLTEIWTRKRGAAEAEFTRNENNFYIDGVPKKKSEYTAVVSGIVDEEVFKIITNPLYFNESVNWKNRRTVLLAICGDISDEEVINSNPELSALTSLLQGKSVADFKDITTAGMRKVNQELEMIPVKINEAELAKPSGSLEVNEDRKIALTARIEALRTRKSDILNGGEAAQAKQRVRMLRQELDNVGKNDMQEVNEANDKVTKLTTSLHDCEFIIGKTKNDITLLKSSIEAKKQIRQGYSKEWDEVFNERFTDNTCPTCGRTLEAGEIEEKTNAFNLRKATRLDEIERKNENAGIELRALEHDLEVKNEALRLSLEALEKIKSDIQKAHEEKTALADKAYERHEKERFRIEGDIAEAEALIRSYEDNTTDAVAEVEREIIGLSAELSTINEAIANKALLEKQNIRIAELREQQKKLATEYTTAERNLYLAEKFIVTKVRMLDERINQKFKYAKFKLFDKQINGGIAEVCEVTYKGVSYKDLNNAMRINIGLDTINTISAHYGISAPIMIDNAESVNEVFHTEAQQIRFYVSHDKKLVIND